MTHLEYLEKIYEIGLKRKWFKSLLSWSEFECHAENLSIKIKGVAIFRENFKEYKIPIKNNNEEEIFKLDNFLVKKIRELIPQTKHIIINMVEKMDKKETFINNSYKRINKII